MSREAVGRALVAKAIADYVKDYVDEQKATATAEMTPGDRVAFAHNDTSYGTISMSNGRKFARITDMAGFLNWVRVAHPERIVEQVHADYVARVLHTAAHYGVAVDTDTGEVIPGVEVIQAEPYPVLRPSVDLKDLVRDKMQGLTRLIIEGPR